MITSRFHISCCVLETWIRRRGLLSLKKYHNNLQIIFIFPHFFALVIFQTKVNQYLLHLLPYLFSRASNLFPWIVATLCFSWLNIRLTLRTQPRKRPPYFRAHCWKKITIKRASVGYQTIKIKVQLAWSPMLT